MDAFEVEARAAYFLPQDHHMKEIYGKKGFADFELEVSAPPED